jgi:predicted CopG family antitoxin
MSHKKIMVSEEAYKSLARLKKERESFSNVILRITKKGTLLEYIKSAEPSEDLSEKVEDAYLSRENIRGREVEF